MELELPVFPVGESEANRDRQTWQQRRTRPAASDRPRNSPSPVPIRLCPPPKTPRKRGSFRGRVAGRGCRVSATADYMAERVGFEPTVPFWGTRALQARAFSRSAISPRPGAVRSGGEGGIRTPDTAFGRITV